MLRLETVRLAGVPLSIRSNGTRFATFSDVDGDGLQDVVLHFSVPALASAGAIPRGVTSSRSPGRSPTAVACVRS